MKKKQGKQFMNCYSVLDCTLRDGAYQFDKNFSMNFNQQIYKALGNSNIEYIEIGFLQNESNHKNNVFINERDKKIKEITLYKKKQKKQKITVLADFSRYSFDNLGPCNKKGIEVIRLCFYRHELNLISNVIEQILNLKYEIFLQPVDILSYEQTELSVLLSIANKAKINCLSIVDTFGSMNTLDLRKILCYFEEILNKNIMIGLHTHNNSLQSFELMKEMKKYINHSRKIVVDCTLSGIGRGAGNLPTEICTNYLNKYLDANYNIIEILEVIYRYNSIFGRSGYNLKSFISSTFNTHINTIDYILTKVSCINDLIKVLNSLDDLSKKRYVYKNIDKTINKIFNLTF